MKGKVGHPLENLIKVLLALQAVTLLLLVAQTFYQDRGIRNAARTARQAMRVACRSQVAAVQAQAPAGDLVTKTDEASGETAMLIRGKWLVMPDCEQNPYRPVAILDGAAPEAAGNQTAVEAAEEMANATSE